MFDQVALETLEPLVTNVKRLRPDGKDCIMVLADASSKIKKELWNGTMEPAYYGEFSDDIIIVSREERLLMARILSAIKRLMTHSIGKKDLDTLARAFEALLKGDIDKRTERALKKDLNKVGRAPLTDFWREFTLPFRKAPEKK